MDISLVSGTTHPQARDALHEEAATDKYPALCQICTFSLANQPQALLTCPSSSCQKIVHRQCFRVWEHFLATQGHEGTCVYCRRIIYVAEDWGEVLKYEMEDEWEPLENVPRRVGHGPSGDGDVGDSEDEEDEDASVVVEDASSESLEALEEDIEDEDVEDREEGEIHEGYEGYDGNADERNYEHELEMTVENEERNRVAPTMVNGNAYADANPERARLHELLMSTESSQRNVDELRELLLRTSPLHRDREGSVQSPDPDGDIDGQEDEEMTDLEQDEDEEDELGELDVPLGSLMWTARAVRLSHHAQRLENVSIRGAYGADNDGDDDTNGVPNGISSRQGHPH